MSAPARGTPEVRIVSYAATNNQQDCDSLFANYTKPNAKGLAVHDCCCGRTCGPSLTMKTSEMDRILRSPLRAYMDQKGIAPKEPKLTPTSSSHRMRTRIY